VLAPGNLSDVVAERAAKLGAFPMLGYFGDGEVALVHHFVPRETNTITGVTRNGAAIVGLEGDGDVIEIRSLEDETLGKGKSFKLDTMVEAARDGGDPAKLKYTTTSKDLRSFTFCPGLFLPRFDGCTETVMAEDLFKWAAARIKEGAKDDTGLKEDVKTYMEPLTWLVWAGRGKLPCFPTKTLPSQATRLWHMRIVALKLTDPAAKRRKASDDNVMDRTTPVVERIPEKVAQKEKSSSDRWQAFEQKTPILIWTPYQEQKVLGHKSGHYSL